MPKFYPNALYTITFNLLYYYLCKRHFVWEVNPRGVNWKAIRATHIFFVTPSMVLLALSKLPNNLYRKVFHLVFAIGASTMMDYLLVKIRMLKLKRGWSMRWSGLFYIKMYLYNYLLQKRPIHVLFLSVISTLFFVIKFNVPMTKRLLRGPTLLFSKKKVAPFETKIQSLFN